jgi:hypothetical protein
MEKKLFQGWKGYIDPLRQVLPSPSHLVSRLIIPFMDQAYQALPIRGSVK